MMFWNVMSNVADCFGYKSACWSISGDITLDATVMARLASSMPCSTLARSSLFSRTIRKNWRISSSRLSLSSRWPRTAVRRRPLSRVSSIRVGLIVLLAMRTPPYACFLGRYFSMNSGLMRLSSVSGRMDSSSQPMFSVSSMERFSSWP